MRIEAIYVYPIKSLRAVDCTTATLTQKGFPYDRRFMLLRDHGKAEGNPKKNGTPFEPMHIGHTSTMCLFSPSFVDDSTLEVTYKNPENGEEKSIEFPLEPNTSSLPEIPVCMHQSNTTGFKMPQSDWFSEQFGYPVVLAYLGSNSRVVLGNLAPNAATRNPIRQQQANATAFSRLTSAGWGMLGSKSNNGEDEDYYIGFADCAPFLLTSTESLDHISARFDDGAQMDITKFRPNILVSGADEAFDEDYWAQVTVKRASNPTDAVLHVTTNCVRCASITVDYDTGKFGTGATGNAFKLLMKDRRVDESNKYNPVFGRYAFLDRACEGETISVGDELHVTLRNEQRTSLKWPGIGGTKKDDLYAL